MNLQRLLRLKDQGVIQSVVVAIAKSKGGPSGISVTVAGEYSKAEEARLRAVVTEEAEAGRLPVFIRFEKVSEEVERHGAKRPALLDGACLLRGGCCDLRSGGGDDQEPRQSNSLQAR